MWKTVFFYALALALGMALLQWLDYQRFARVHSTELYASILALAFLVLGIWVGVRVFRPHQPVPFDGNPQARETLKLSDREMDVLQQLAAGGSNKDIARALNVSPHTVKTHVGNVFEKLGARRRTDAINRARELGILR
jgi:DNA-binding CsgD family transcriptional regulator